METVLSLALDKVTQATSLEREGQLDQAVPLMEEAVNIFQTQIKLADESMKPILEMYLNMYSEKLEALKKPEIPLEDDFEVINRQEWQGLIQEDCYDFLEKDLCFDKAVEDYALLSVIPDEQPLRPFFFMRLIQKTIAEGAFLTEHLFIPREVWTQERLQLFEAEKKLEMIGKLSQEMRGLGVLKKNNGLSKNYG